MNTIRVFRNGRELIFIGEPWASIIWVAVFVCVFFAGFAIGQWGL